MQNQNFSAFDFSVMRRLISLAAGKKGATGANPTVASAVVKDGKIVGEGVHQGEGLPHAEVLAINQAGDQTKGATLYVTLEPCTHVGRTPACTDLISRSGISKVIYAIDDPNPLVRREPARVVLERHGIEVVSGLMAKEAELLNEAFFYFHRTGNPFVILKAGMSLDGKIAMASGESTYITSEASRIQVHKIRREVNAILVGVGTVIQDNPSLNVRYGLLTDGFKNPVKVILDPFVRTPVDAQLFEANDDTDIVIVIREDQLEHPHLALLSEKAIILPLHFEEGRFHLKSLLDVLLEHGIISLLIEGGQKVYSAALEDEIVTKVIIFEAPLLIASRGALSPFERAGIELLEESLVLNRVTTHCVGPDLMIEAYLD